jgi:hypothetical protein
MFGQPFFLFWDTETDGHGGFKQPLVQNLMQIAWVVTDRAFNTIRTQNLFVRGNHKVSPSVPHNITTAYANAHGVDPQNAMDLFMADVVSVSAAGGCVVAHNIDFDIKVVNYAIATHHIVEHPQFGWNPAITFCTMKDRRIIRHCGNNGKWVKLEKMYTKLIGPLTEKAHDALGDARMVRDCFRALLEQNIITLPHAAPECTTTAALPSLASETHVCNASECDMLVNASDVSIISGMMTRFDRHPADVAERVLARHEQNLGLSINHLHLSAAESECARVLDQACTAAASCTSVSVLGKREREMHNKVDATTGITAAVAAEAKRLVTSGMNCAYGTARENVAVRAHHIQENNLKAYYIYGGQVAHLDMCKKWGIVGRIDGFCNNKLVEIKHRRRKLFDAVPNYERIQLEVYMRMTEMSSAVLMQKLENSNGVRQTEVEVQEDDELWEFILLHCGEFFKKLLRLICTENLWQQWNAADKREDRQRVWECL